MDAHLPIEEMTYEQAFAELEDILAALETNQRPLEEAMALFERGQALAQHCSSLLDKAELKIRVLSGERSDIPDDLIRDEQNDGSDDLDLTDSEES